MTDINHRVVDSNGINMHYVEAGEGPLVVLCHGFPESWYSWRHQILALAANGYHAVAPDQRGYGRTDAPDDIAAYSLFHLVGDIVGLVHALGEETAVVVGHDWGAPVAWNAAMWRPDIFRGVVAMSVPLANRPPYPPTAGMKATFGDNFFYILHFQTPGVAEHELQKDVKRSLRMLLYSASGDNTGRGGGPLPKSAGFLDSMTDPEQLPDWLTEGDLDYFAREFKRTGFRGGLNWYRNLDRNWVLSAPFQGMKVTQPALYLIGEKDVTRGFLSAEQLRDSVPNLTEVVTFPGIGHWTQQENPAGTNAALLKFLDSLD